MAILPGIQLREADDQFCQKVEVFKEMLGSEVFRLNSWLDDHEQQRSRLEGLQLDDKVGCVGRIYVNCE